MTVIETIHKYGLESMNKHYKNTYGNGCDLKYPLDKLAQKKVKAIEINFPTNTVTITIFEY